MDYFGRGGRPGGCFFEGEHRTCGFDGICPHKQYGGVCTVEDSELLTQEGWLSDKLSAGEITDDHKTLMVRMRTLRVILDNSKNEKLMARWEKYGDYRQYDLTDLIGAWEAETKELETALANYGPTEILGELVDVINQLEFIYDVLELWKC